MFSTKPGQKENKGKEIEQYKPSADEIVLEGSLKLKSCNHSNFTENKVNLDNKGWENKKFILTKSNLLVSETNKEGEECYENLLALKDVENLFTVDALSGKRSWDGSFFLNILKKKEKKDKEPVEQSKESKEQMESTLLIELLANPMENKAKGFLIQIENEETKEKLMHGITKEIIQRTCKDLEDKVFKGVASKGEKAKLKVQKVKRQAEMKKAILREAKMPLLERLRVGGFPSEEHIVETPDGYLLTLFRIPYSNVEDQYSRRPVILLMHGLMDSCVTWVINENDHSLAFMLARAGFDVWLGNVRGTRWGMKHRKFKPTSSKFWAFNRDMFVWDLRRIIDFILLHTSQQSLSYVGHSQGGCIAFKLCCEDPDYFKSKINFFAGLGPAVFVGNLRCTFLVELKFMSDKQLKATFGNKSFGVADSLVNKAFPSLVANTPTLSYEVTKRFLAALTGWNPHKNFSADRLPMVCAHSPGGTSVNNIINWKQAMTSGKFQKFDFGKKLNKMTYGSEKPPEYNLKNCKDCGNIAIFYGGEDLLTTKEDEEHLISIINPYYSQFLPNYGHLDYVWGYDANVLIYPKIIELATEFSHKAAQREKDMFRVISEKEESKKVTQEVLKTILLQDDPQEWDKHDLGPNSVSFLKISEACKKWPEPNHSWGFGPVDNACIIHELSRKSKYLEKAQKRCLVRPFLLLASMHPKQRLLWTFRLKPNLCDKDFYGDAHAESWHIIKAFEGNWWSVLARLLLYIMLPSGILPDDLKKEITDATSAKSRKHQKVDLQAEMYLEELTMHCWMYLMGNKTIIEKFENNEMQKETKEVANLMSVLEANGIQRDFTKYGIIQLNLAQTRRGTVKFHASLFKKKSGITNLYYNHVAPILTVALGCVGQRGWLIGKHLINFEEYFKQQIS
eukprot:CAMPEP_0174274848 /NCGR_PEP_ID=MMETSP0439-20130205/59499_1 /TAXON_ID=0 /ORGANISM="Stereomyxa ramosa, Strain Chinc5" /LENGTH=905 /DNA_ID=CAMNT_0015366889 /DNA_START=14 /DNA_END=2731 /DNA_ORIENTATION=+